MDGGTIFQVCYMAKLENCELYSHETKGGEQQVNITKSEVERCSGAQGGQGPSGLVGKHKEGKTLVVTILEDCDVAVAPRYWKHGNK